MAMISVEAVGPRKFIVRVRDGVLETTHHVEISGNFQSEHGLSAVAPETLVERSFEFLLEREPANLILSAFTLDQIGRYFPEYAGEIARRVD